MVFLFFAQLTPLLLQSLSSPNTELRVATLHTVSILVSLAHMH